MDSNTNDINNANDTNNANDANNANNTKAKRVSKCSICKEEGHNAKNKKYHPSESNDVVQQTQNPIADLELLREVFMNPEAQMGLVTLYSHSQSECTRNGACGMEIGMSREKDQGAVLKLFLGDKIKLDIDNELTEDYIVGNEKISAKHSSGRVGTRVKAKWTSSDIPADVAKNEMINANDSYYPNMLLTYLDIKNDKVTIICVTSEHNRTVIKNLKDDAFFIPNGNSRGIEYSTRAMKELLNNRYFTVEFQANIKDGMDPIERRIQILKNLGINA